MLRRKLLFVLGILILMMLATALSSVLFLRSVLEDFEHINAVVMTSTTTTSRLGETVVAIEAELNAFRETDQASGIPLDAAILSLHSQIEQLQIFYAVEGLNETPPGRLFAVLTSLEYEIDSLLGVPSEAASTHIERALKQTRLMRIEVLKHAEFALNHMKSEQQRATSRFRHTAIGLAITFVVLINISVIVLMRTAAFVLKPIDCLVEASRHLALEEYDHRVEVNRKDEFDELAQAFNHLAEQLQTNEQRKVETLHQVARTLNHELNNAIAIIELQLSLVARSSGQDPASSKQLNLIHETLGHMNKTVFALTQVRRVVLTEYVQGVKMLDLQRSTEHQHAPETGSQSTGTA